MLKNYILTAYRSLTRNGEYASINIIGLAISIASCVILFYIVRYELSFDSFHANTKKIFRIVNQAPLEGGIDYGQGIPAPLPDAVRLDFPEISQVGTIFSIPGSQIDIIDENSSGEQTKFMEERGVFFAEPQFFNIFDFGWLHGSAVSLNEPNSAVLTQETAEKYFGNWKDAIGKSIEYRNNFVLKITGILKNIPPNSDFPLKVVISFKTRGQENSSWGSITSRRQCYILLDDEAQASNIQNLMAAFARKHHGQGSNNQTQYVLQPLSEVHFDDRFGNFNNRTVSKLNLTWFGLIGFLLMITASINFVNLTVAQVMKRSKEVGIRKVLGSSRWQLAGQFIGEATLLLMVSSMLAMVLTELILPPLRPILNLPDQFRPASTFEVIVFLVVVSTVIIGLSTIYPARVMGALKPVQALKSKISLQTVGGTSVRKGLVVSQFVIAQVLVAATLITVDQLNFFHQTPLGFDKNGVVLLDVPTDSLSQTKLEPFRSKLLEEPQVSNVSFSFTAPLSQSNRRSGFQFDNSSDDAPFEANLKYTDAEYFEFYNLSLIAGRFYETSDTAKAYVVNRTFLERMGILNPAEGLDKLITMDDVSLPIIGVVEDFHLLSLQEKIEPMIMMSLRNEYRNAAIKVEAFQSERMLQRLEKIFRDFFPDDVFEYRLLEENINKAYANEERLSYVMKIFCGVAVAVSCLGLYGLISFMTVQRTKEVGVRKVLGASVRDIILLFYREFIVLVLLGFVISTPATWYFMSDWLNTFAYRVNLSPWIFILAFSITLIVATMAISFRTIKASLANPVDSLRNE